MPSRKNSAREGLRIDQPGLYRIRVQGGLVTDLSDRMGGMQISSEVRPEGSIITTLQGRLLDQAALLGVLMALYNTRLPLLSVELIAGQHLEGQPLVAVNVQNRGDYLEFTVRGDADSLQAPEPIETILNSCKLADIYRVLIDFRGLKGVSADEPEVGFARVIGDRYQEHLDAERSPLHVAIVAGENVFAAWRQIEQELEEHGLSVFAASSKAEAVAWLRKQTMK